MWHHGIDAVRNMTAVAAHSPGLASVVLAACVAGFVGVACARTAPAVSAATEGAVEVVERFYATRVPKEGDPLCAADPEGLTALFVPELPEWADERARAHPRSLGGDAYLYGFRWLLTSVRVTEEQPDRCIVETLLLLTAPAALWEMGTPRVWQEFALVRRGDRWLIVSSMSPRYLRWHMGPRPDLAIRPASPDEERQLLSAYNAYMDAWTRWDEDALWRLTAGTSYGLCGRAQLMRKLRAIRRPRDLAGEPRVWRIDPDHRRVLVYLPPPDAKDDRDARLRARWELWFVPEGGSWKVWWPFRGGRASVPQPLPTAGRTAAQAGQTPEDILQIDDGAADEGGAAPAAAEVVRRYYAARAPKAGSPDQQADPEALRQLFTPANADRLSKLTRENQSIGDPLRRWSFRWYIPRIRVTEHAADRCIVEARIVIRDPEILGDMGIPDITERFYLLGEGDQWRIDGMGLSPPLRWHIAEARENGGRGIPAGERDKIMSAFKDYADASARWDEDRIWNLAGSASRQLLGRTQLLRLARERRVVKLGSDPVLPAALDLGSPSVPVEVAEAEMEEREGTRTGRVVVELVPEGAEWKVQWLPELGPNRTPTPPSDVYRPVQSPASSSPGAK